MSRIGWDMHMHSTHSDGTYTPKELINAAKKKSLKGISITDHDSISAYDESLFAYAKSEEVDLIVGAEFSTAHNQIPVHILAYDIDLKNEKILQLCQAHKTRREDRNKQIIKKLQDHNVDITYEELEATGATAIGRPHIANLLMQKGIIKTIKEAFEVWIGDDRKCFALGQIFQPQETIEIIKNAGGIAVLAHPILLKKKGIIKNLIQQFKFDGMECYYAAFSADQKYQMVKIAKEYDLLITGGSDFHGSTKPYLNIGASYTSEEDMQKLRGLR